MVRPSMKVNYPGLIKEPLPSGAFRYRVRERGNPKNRIRIYCAPSDADFTRQYTLARLGEQPKPLVKAVAIAKPKSVGWLVNAYLDHLEKLVANGTSSPKTLKKKRNLLNRLLAFQQKEMLIPTERLQEMHDEMLETPSQADAFIEATGVMFQWAKKRGFVKSNPALGVERSYIKGEGAIPWKLEDVRKFLSCHLPGSKAHLSLTILLCTLCRIEDLTILGRKHETVIDGVQMLRWTPTKKGSSEVIIPFLAPMRAAVKAQKVIGETYVLGRGGKPFASGDSMSAMFKRWCVDAGLPKLSAHGIRKSGAEFLAEQGCSQYEIMAIMGHSEAKTSEIYTKKVARGKLAAKAMEKVDVSRGLF